MRENFSCQVCKKVTSIIGITVPIKIANGNNEVKYFNFLFEKNSSVGKIFKNNFFSTGKSAKNKIK